MSKIYVALLIGCILKSANSRPNLFDLETAESELLEFKEGRGKVFHEAQQSERGEKGDRGFKSVQEEVKGAKGHHDVAGEKKDYAVEGAHKNGHHHDDGYYAEQHKGEEGSKGYSYVDKGSYAKGHSTKGHHNVHKLDEYKKKTEFFDKDHDEAFKEKHGAYEISKGVQKEGFEQGGHLNKGYHQGEFGQKAESEKGGHFFNHAGHDKKKGDESFYKNAEEFAHKGGDAEFKKFGHREEEKYFL